MFRLTIFKSFIIAALMTGTLYAQDAVSRIKQDAIRCEGFPVPNPPLYSYLKDYKCICIGEMHGTQEPAELLVYLTQLFVNAHKKVIVGFEIPKTAMSAFAERQDSAHLSQSEFFVSASNDGRASEAWFKAMNACNRQGVSFCFFDASADSFMYVLLMEQYRTDTSAVILTLSGNIHNKFCPTAIRIRWAAT